MDHDSISDQTARALQHRIAVAQRDGRVPSLAASIARRAAPVWFGAAGLRDAADGDTARLPTEQTQYRVGSITKTMIAVCVLRLVDRGEVDLSDRLGDHLPDAPAPDSTIHQLLSHTAGLASETPPPWWERTPGDIRPTLADVLTPDPLRHRPGQTFHYSNPGFGLLGELVARRAGRPWFDVLREDVLAPLGMTRTTYWPQPPHARGWAVHPWADVLLPEPAHDHGLLAAAGQLWSTPGDLCRFAVFLGGDGAGILTPETLERMRTPASAPSDAGWSGSYGLGVQHLRFGDRVLFGHTGSMPGFLAIALTSPDDGVAVAVQANAWSALALRELAGDLVDIVIDREPTMPAPWTGAAHVDAAAYELVGPWYWGAVATAITLRADGRLELAGIGGSGRVARFVATEDGRWRGLSGYYDGEYLETRRDAAGSVTHLDLGSFVFTRRPYGPGDVVPGGLELGDWQV
ncbi:serine hydrolase domain-containing protein [uncultured Jatrophihabitans sp.]|uniref:serine hydrolase domain-containing protein n=1 Tax=uncultured Jatrophihabitans sp. TaxID=1610747 RepID=UPI0035CADC82